MNTTLMANRKRNPNNYETSFTKRLKKKKNQANIRNNKLKLYYIIS